MPTYLYKCECWPEVLELVRQVADHDEPVYCDSCTANMTRLFAAPAVMNTALPDGTKRFDTVRNYQRLERAKRGADTTEKAKLSAEQRKILKET